MATNVMFPIAMNELGLCANFGTSVGSRDRNGDTERTIRLPDNRMITKIATFIMPDNTWPRFDVGSPVVMARPDLDPEKIRMPRSFWNEIGLMTVCKIRWYPRKGFLYMVEELPMDYQRWISEAQLAVPMEEDAFSVLDALRQSCDPDTLEKVRAGLRSANKEHVVANL